MVIDKAVLTNPLAPVTGGIVRVGDNVYGIYFGGWGGSDDVNKG